MHSTSGHLQSSGKRMPNILCTDWKYFISFLMWLAPVPHIPFRYCDFLLWTCKYEWLVNCWINLLFKSFLDPPNFHLTWNHLLIPETILIMHHWFQEDFIKQYVDNHQGEWHIRSIEENESVLIIKVLVGKHFGNRIINLSCKAVMDKTCPWVKVRKLEEGWLQQSLAGTEENKMEQLFGGNPPLMCGD